MSLRLGVLTVSDRTARGEREDSSGPALARLIAERGWQVIATGVVPDEVTAIRSRLIDWIDRDRFDVVLTTGGTGFSPRDVTPEAVESIFDRYADGIAEAMRAASLKITPHAMLSRGVAGIRKNTLIITLPGSPSAAVENFQVVIPVLEHAVQLLRGMAGSEQGHEYGRG